MSAIKVIRIVFLILKHHTLLFYFPLFTKLSMVVQTDLLKIVCTPCDVRMIFNFRSISLRNQNILKAVHAIISKVLVRGGSVNVSLISSKKLE